MSKIAALPKTQHSFAKTAQTTEDYLACTVLFGKILLVPQILLVLDYFAKISEEVILNRRTASKRNACRDSNPGLLDEKQVCLPLCYAGPNLKHSLPRCRTWCG